MNLQNEKEFMASVEIAKRSPNILKKQEAVVAKYGPQFDPRNVSNLKSETVRLFLRFSENQHWTGINRTSGMITEDEKKMRTAIAELVDETKPIAERIDRVTGGDGGHPIIKGLGRAIISAILQVTYPNKYGVYNKFSMEGLEKIGLNPESSDRRFKNLSLGKRYQIVNDILKQLSDEYGISLWALDWAFFKMLFPNEASSDFDEGIVERADASAKESESNFKMEKYLEEFLVENWEKTPFSKEYDLIVGPDEEIYGFGQQVPTDVGRIDLLARSKKGTDYLVLELKRNQSSDQTIGQLQRYRGWVKKNLAGPNDKVDGVVISYDSDKALLFALSVTPSVRHFSYAVSFTLSESV